MPEHSSFRDFVQRIRAGDSEAALELVRQYEPLIRREIRMQLRDRRLHRLLDSMDVCQSVLGSFFLRTGAGQYDLDRPEQLVRLLVSMAHNKLISTARLHQAGRRDIRRTHPISEADLDELEDVSPSPSQVIIGKDLLERFRELLTEEERRLIDLRNKGRSWSQIALEMGGTSQARRMQLSRAIERASEKLGIEMV
jgi:RNA polymerase sigma-70 factor (ECF subfamily)